MIIARSPLRITLGGGGTDLPEWYRQFGGFLISASINKYIYTTGSLRPFDKKYWLSYSRVEVCDHISEIKHELLAKCLGRYQFRHGIEIHSISEVPGNSGLGSSGSFLVGTLKLLNALQKLEVTRQDLAEAACKIEMIDLQRSSGKQDQYIAAFGGIASLTLNREGEVKVETIDLPEQTTKRLETNLLIFYSGITRDSNEVLAEQSKSFKEKSKSQIDAMHEIQRIGFDSRDCLLSGDLDKLGDLMHKHWIVKKEMSSKMTNSSLDEIYSYARSHGATGGKIMGAGGGGYWMFYVPPNDQLRFRAKMSDINLVEMMWGFDFNGCSLIYSR
ncbi:MAG: hypothetical protein KA436_01355 [Oligoflexales bacterium]|nr:hypothetical protein [Oligoflexales bacterium]